MSRRKQKAMYKTNNSHLSVPAYSNNEPRTSKRGKNISHVTRLWLVAYFFFLITFRLNPFVIRVQSSNLFVKCHIRQAPLLNTKVAVWNVPQCWSCDTWYRIVRHTSSTTWNLSTHSPPWILLTLWIHVPYFVPTYFFRCETCANRLFLQPQATYFALNTLVSFNSVLQLLSP